MNDRVKLFEKGCLGTCWYGKYHYMEPWIGCEHNCSYCYAKFRTEVKNTLKDQNTTFEHPELIYDIDKTIELIKTETEKQKIKLVKLSRYTDFFTKKFVDNGIAYRILEALFKSNVQRIIITTKGVPNKELIDLMEKYKEKVSYNSAIKPCKNNIMEKAVPGYDARMKAAEEVNRRGILTTIHMDPLVAGLDDSTKYLERTLCDLEKAGIKRVMFSYLLLSDEVIDDMKLKIEAENLLKIIECFDIDNTRQYLPRQKETFYYALKKKLKSSSIKRISKLLNEKNFEFVLCSLKSGHNCDNVDKKSTPLCDGTFYA